MVSGSTVASAAMQPVEQVLWVFEGSVAEREEGEARPMVDILVSLTVDSWEVDWGFFERGVCDRKWYCYVSFIYSRMFFIDGCERANEQARAQESRGMRRGSCTCIPFRPKIKSA